MGRTITIGSRGSDLALWQAKFTKKQLEDLGHHVSISIIKTKGDIIQHLSFDKIEGKGFFTKELEEALLEGTIDLAVHSHKDLPTTHPEGLTIAGVSYREDPTESLLSRPEAADFTRELNLREGAVVGTSSHRRKSQLLHIRPDLIIEDLRGNVPTRVDKLKRGDYDAIVLASAGLNRLALDLGELRREIISQYRMIPAPAQGVLAFQIRENDEEMKEIIRSISNEGVQASIAVERTVLNRLDGGCLLPLGVYCEATTDGFQAWASLQPLDGSPFRRTFVRGNNAETLGTNLLDSLTRAEDRVVYISRNPEDAMLFINQLSDFGFKVIAKSPVRFETIHGEETIATDWIFFTSKSSVTHFFINRYE